MNGAAEQGPGRVKAGTAAGSLKQTAPGPPGKPPALASGREAIPAKTLPNKITETRSRSIRLLKQNRPE